MMRYSKFASDLVSVLGFGGLRFPSYANDDKHIDVEKSVEMLCRSFDLGVNYVDTSPVYRGGESEYVIGKALKQTLKKVYVSTKFPFLNNPKSGEYTRELENSLKRMDIDCVDFYHFHGITKDIFDNIIIPQFFLKEALKAKDQGLVRHISFSFHDKPDAMKYIIDKAEIMETVLCQYNIIDQSNEEAMHYAKQKGLGIAVMGPLGGGKFIIPNELTKNGKHIRNDSTAETGLKFVLHNENVDIVLSGMKSIQMLEENVKIVSEYNRINQDDDVDKFNKMISENRIIADCYCTECSYCLPCPQNINIPYVLRLLNFHRVDGLTQYAREKFFAFQEKKDIKISTIGSTQPVSIGENPSNCKACGICEKRCPQRLKISQKISEAVHELG